MALILTHVLLGGVLSDSAEPDDVLVVDVGGNHVHLARGVDVTQQLLVEFVRALQPEADEPQL